jgi:hypothetical protein
MKVPQPNTNDPGSSVEVKNVREKDMKFKLYFSAAKSVSLAGNISRYINIFYLIHMP